MQMKKRAWTMTAARAVMFGAVTTACVGTGVVTAVAQPLGPVPSPEQLTANLSTIFDTGASQSVRAGYLEGGSRAIPSADAVGNALRGAPITLQVQNPTLNGDRLDTQLAVSMAGMGMRSFSLAWVFEDAQWKLSNQSFCAISNQITNSCSI